MKNLRDAPTEEDARIWSQRLRGLDTEERGRRVRWTQIDQELAQYQTTMANLRNMPRVDLKRVGREQEHLTQLQEERAQQQQTLAEMEKEMRLRQEVAFHSYEEATKRRDPDPYLRMWQVARSQQEGRREPEKQEPEKA